MATDAAPPKPTPDVDLTCDERHLGGCRDSRRRARAPCSERATVDAVAEVFKLLGDPTRVRLRRRADATANAASATWPTLVGLTESAVSHQLRLLRAARLVRVRRAGRLAYYSLDDHHVVGLLHDTRKHVEEAARVMSDACCGGACDPTPARTAAIAPARDRTTARHGPMSRRMAGTSRLPAA